MEALRARYRIRPTMPQGSVTLFVELEGDAPDELSTVDTFNTLELAMNYVRDILDTRGDRIAFHFDRETGEITCPWIAVLGGSNAD